jgi:hypothetical protein
MEAKTKAHNSAKNKSDVLIFGLVVWFKFFIVCVFV